MLPAAHRALLVLVAALGALTASRAGAACVDVDQRPAASAASPLDGSGSDRNVGWPALAIFGEPAPDSVAGGDDAGSGPPPARAWRELAPLPEASPRDLDPRSRSAFAPGELPPALAFLRTNGDANAGGAGT